jgi:hypothetical protein
VTVIPSEWVSVVLTGSAAAALFWTIKQLISGNLHTNSEVDGLHQDKKDLLMVNRDLSEALDTSNHLLEEAIRQGKGR